MKVHIVKRGLRRSVSLLVDNELVENFCYGGIRSFLIESEVKLTPGVPYSVDVCPGHFTRTARDVQTLQVELRRSINVAPYHEPSRSYTRFSATCYLQRVLRGSVTVQYPLPRPLAPAFGVSGGVAFTLVLTPVKTKRARAALLKAAGL